jgi:beta-galactosidase
VSRGGADLSYYRQWLSAGLNHLRRKAQSVSVSVSRESLAADVAVRSDGVKITASWILVSPDDSAISIEIPVTVTYSFSISGELEVAFSSFLPSSMPPPPRVGLRMALCSSMTEVNWLGLGPYEAYDDRLASVHMGEFSMSVEELHTPYVFPQECGRRQQPR